MKTTELFVEQVLIGFLVLLVAALVFWADVYAFLVRRSDKSLDLLVTGGILVGAAYLIGMVYDRVADTLLQDIESHGRLQFALARFKLKSGKVRSKETRAEHILPYEKDVKDFDTWVAAKRDPFEDGKYRMIVLGNPEATAQMEYLRSRIRLTRAMATIIPGLTMAFLLALDGGQAGVCWAIVALAVPLAYALALFPKTLKPRKKLFYRPPKTYKLRKVRKYLKRAGMLHGEPEKLRHISWLVAHDEVWFALGGLTLAAVLLILKTQNYAWFSILIVGLILTFIVGWTWWRISMTFYAFVLTYSTYGAKTPASTSAEPGFEEIG